jgi:hypothetical protein
MEEVEGLRRVRVTGGCMTEDFDHLEQVRAERGGTWEGSVNRESERFTSPHRLYGISAPALRNKRRY